MFPCELVDLNALIIEMTCATRASIRMEVLKEATAAVSKGKMSILITKLDKELMFIYHGYNSSSSAV